MWKTKFGTQISLPLPLLPEIQLGEGTMHANQYKDSKTGGGGGELHPQPRGCISTKQKLY